MESTFQSISDFAIILVLGAGGGIIANYLKLPSILGYILAGVSFSFLGLIIPNISIVHSEFVGQVSMLGVALLLFASGIEFSTKAFANIKRLVIIGTLMHGQ